MTPPKVVIYGVGSMGSTLTRMALDKGADVVGAIARSADKVGRDVGEVAGLGREIGVVVSDDGEQVFSTNDVDIALISTVSGLDEMYEHFRVCIENGANAISLSEEWLYPWLRAPETARRLDDLARAHGVTVTAGGHQDGYWLGLAGALIGTAHQLDALRGKAMWNPDDYGPVAADFMPIDLSVDEFQPFMDAGSGPPSYGDSVLGILAARGGLTPRNFTHRRTPEIAEKDMLWRSLNRQVVAGRVIGFTDTDVLETEEGPTLTLEMTGRLYDDGDVDINEWTIHGEPTVTVSTPAVPSDITTCTALVNRIPDVVNAPAGFVTIDQLPPMRYRPRPLEQDIERSVSAHSA
jgi:4-hydroxy-tetrahydrodipicolinate reductase